MSKYRIYDLAKENNISSKEVLDILAKNNFKDFKKAANTVGEAEKAVVLKALADKNKPQGERAQATEQRNRPQARPAHENKERKNDEQKRPAHRNERMNQERNNQQKNSQQKNNQQRNGSHSGGNRSNNNNNNGNSNNNNNNNNNNNRSRNNNNNAENRRDGGTNGARGRQPNRSNGGANGNNGRYNNNNNRAGSNNFNNLRKQGPGAKKGGPNKKNQNSVQKPVKPVKEKPSVIQVGESITVKELAGKMCCEVSEIIKKLMMLGIMATINQEIDFDTASLIATEFEIAVEELPPEQDPTEIPQIEDDPRTLMLRPPVVTVMGHVDHGKTSLLDVIRKTHVTSREAGGITQHIGAYQAVCQKKKIVFLDTPGHEAFTAMRARGAQITDIAILVVAADDGVMPQTIEAINHAKSANVPIIVAINKIDREGANPDHVKQQLSEYGLISEEWGGDTIMVPVSAKKQIGINDLLEMVLLVAEVQELKANPNRAAEGVIIEAQLDKGRGPVATVLVQKGTLRIGDSIIAGTAYGKVRAMMNDRGEKVKKAGPSMPVEVLGLNDVPEAGDTLNVVEEKVARAVAEKRVAKKRSEDMAPTQKVSLDALFDQIKEGEIKDLNIVVKADVQGSVEAIKGSLLALNEKSDEVRVSIVHSGVGGVNESDVMLASASNALIIAFNVRPDANARRVADAENIDIRTYRVIYEAINDVKAAMSGMLAPQYKEVILGHVEIRQVMSFSKALVAGSYVLDGKVTNSSKLRLLRDNVVVHEGAVESLRRFKDDVKEVAAGYECGITLENYRDIKEGDIMEIYTMEEIKQSVD
jgi:translation initiation factor IF-2